MRKTTSTIIEEQIGDTLSTTKTSISENEKEVVELNIPMMLQVLEHVRNMIAAI